MAAISVSPETTIYYHSLKYITKSKCNFYAFMYMYFIFSHKFQNVNVVISLTMNIGHKAKLCVVLCIEVCLLTEDS